MPMQLLQEFARALGEKHAAPGGVDLCVTAHWDDVLA